MKGRKDAAAKAGKGKKAAPKGKDSAYKPPRDEEPERDGGAGTEESDPPRRSERKRPTDGGAGAGAGPASKKQKN